MNQIVLLISKVKKWFYKKKGQHLTKKKKLNIRLTMWEQCKFLSKNVSPKKFSLSLHRNGMINILDDKNNTSIKKLLMMFQKKEHIYLVLAVYFTKKADGIIVQ